MTSGLSWATGAEASPIYWSLFNIEGENRIDRAYVIYAALEDINRLGQYSPDTTGNAARNVVGSGASIMATLPPQPIPEPSSTALIALGLTWRMFVSKHRLA